MDEIGCARAARICLCVLCGLPAAGKSSVARILHGRLLKNDFAGVVFSYDELIPDEAFEFHVGNGEENGGSSWKLRRQGVLRNLERFLDRGCVNGEDGEAWTLLAQELQELQARRPRAAVVILLDDNFYYQSMRYEIYQLARRYSVGFCQLYLHCPVTTCLRRNRTRRHPLPDEVISEMAKRLEPPNPVKNSWEQRSLTLNSDDGFSPEAIELSIGLLTAALDNPLSPIQDDTEQKEADRLHCSSSLMHQADQACRRLVSQVMERARKNGFAPESMRSLATELNQLKTAFLGDLREEVLRWCPISPGESVDVEHMVSRAVAVFDQKMNDCMRKHCTEYNSKPT
ncbi:L-seryl-tRNA(Sec) kinase [Arapaima gigas]